MWPSGESALASAHLRFLLEVGVGSPTWVGSRALDWETGNEWPLRAGAVFRKPRPRVTSFAPLSVCLVSCLQQACDSRHAEASDAASPLQLTEWEEWGRGLGSTPPAFPLALPWLQGRARSWVFSSWSGEGAGPCALLACRLVFVLFLISGRKGRERGQTTSGAHKQTAPTVCVNWKEED